MTIIYEPTTTEKCDYCNETHLIKEEYNHEYQKYVEKNVITIENAIKLLEEYEKEQGQNNKKKIKEFITKRNIDIYTS